MKRLIPEETSIHLYEGNPADSFVLFNWWVELYESQELDKVLFPSTHSLAQFITYFTSGKVKLVYSLDDNGKIRLAVWGEPSTIGVIYLSLWARSSFRHTKEGVQSVIDIYHKVFEMFEVVQGITKQERLLKVHQKWGYKIIAKIPNLWGGLEDGWFLQLTKQDFLKALGAE